MQALLGGLLFFIAERILPIVITGAGLVLIQNKLSEDYIPDLVNTVSSYIGTEPPFQIAMLAGFGVALSNILSAIVTGFSIKTGKLVLSKFNPTS